MLNVRNVLHSQVKRCRRTFVSLFCTFATSLFYFNNLAITSTALNSSPTVGSVTHSSPSLTSQRSSDASYHQSLHRTLYHLTSFNVLQAALRPKTKNKWSEKGACCRKFYIYFDRGKSIERKSCLPGSSGGSQKGNKIQGTGSSEGTKRILLPQRFTRVIGGRMGWTRLFFFAGRRLDA